MAMRILLARLLCLHFLNYCAPELPRKQKQNVSVLLDCDLPLYDSEGKYISEGHSLRNIRIGQSVRPPVRPFVSRSVGRWTEDKCTHVPPYMMHLDIIRQ